VTKLSIIDQGAGHFVIDGDLTFSTIDKQTVKSFTFLSAAKFITIDLGRVACTDSAGLALMIEWIKYTRHHRTQITFKNIPEQLLNLAKLSGFDKTNHFATQTAGGLDFEPLPFTEKI
jgi:phospholipid transport system transporter-binding protein